MSETTGQRRLAAILVADVVGYSRLMEADEAGTLAALRERRKGTVEPLVREHKGRIVKVMGDGVLVEFASAVNALACALALQKGMAEANATLSENRRIEVRIGINLGDIIGEGSDIYGEGVNVAARLEGLAEPGGICVSSKVHDEVSGKLPFIAADLGRVTLKNIARPVRAYRVVEAGPRAATRPAGVQTPTLPDKPSIAVLPFTNMSGDPQQEYFSDGITEDIITELSRFPSLFVIARSSSFTFKGSAVDVADVGRKLGVEYVVEGSVRKADTRVRITAQLIEAASGKHMWAERYDRQLEDIFSVQDEVVGTIASNLGRSLRDMAFARVRERPVGSLTAYEHLLRGRAAWWNGDSDNAFRHVERALKADINYAAAHAWLALQYTYDQFKGDLDLTIEEHAKRASQHVDAALRIDDRDPFVHMAISMVFSFTQGGDRARALRHSDIAIALNPHEFECMYCRAYVLGMHGRYPEALEWLDKARRLNPVTGYLLNEAYYDTYRLMGEYEKALELASSQSELPPHLYVHLSITNACLGRWEEAQSWITKFERAKPKHFDTRAYLRFLIGIGYLSKSEQEAVGRLRKEGVWTLD